MITIQIPWFPDTCSLKSHFYSLLKKGSHNKMTPCNFVSQVKESLVDMKSDSVKFSPRGTWHYYIPHQSWYCFSNNCIRLGIGYCYVIQPIQPGSRIPLQTILGSPKSKHLQEISKSSLVSNHDQLSIFQDFSTGCNGI